LLVSPTDMEHNTNLLTNLQFFVLPMFQFFALPDYVFHDICVPSWVFDKRRSPFYTYTRTADDPVEQMIEPPSNKQVCIPKGDSENSPSNEYEVPEEDRVSASPPRNRITTKVIRREVIPFGCNGPPWSKRPSFGQQGVHGVQANGGGPRPIQSLEAQAAIKRLEEFAGELCASEVCSDSLCHLEQETTASNDELLKQEKALDRIVRARHDMASRKHREGGQGAGSQMPPPAPPRLLGKLLCGRYSTGLTSACTSWCGRGRPAGQIDSDSLDESAVLQGSPRMRMQGPMEPGTSPPQRAAPTKLKGKVDDENVWDRWCGANKANATIDKHEAVDGPEASQQIMERWAVQQSNQMFLRTAQRPPAPGRAPAWTACCHALPSNPLLSIAPPRPPPKPAAAVNEEHSPSLNHNFEPVEQRLDSALTRMRTMPGVAEDFAVHLGPPLVANKTNRAKHGMSM